MPEPFVIHKGAFLGLRLFEVGDEIDLARAEQLLAGGVTRTAGALPGMPHESVGRARPRRERSHAL